MSKKAFKSQASSSKAVSNTFGAFSSDDNFTASSFGFRGVTSSPLSHVYEPPDLRSLSDQNIVVAFKNLQKKDSTTKSKAIEDIQTYVLSHNSSRDGVEEPVLEAWIKVYPRNSIDNSRRVRQFAHMLQGQIAISCGKRIARYMPQLVGAWLAGIYDNDKSVSRATQETFKLVFPSEEKYKNVWRIFQADILRWCKGIIENETVHTLSDERTTSPDDAEIKYARTIGGAILMINNLIEAMPEADLAKCQVELRVLLKSPKLWKFASSPDVFMRCSIYRLLSSLLEHRKNELDPKLVSSNVLTSGLNIDQTGSAYNYAKILVKLTADLPSVWTQDYHGKGKKSARTCLCQFLRKGSQGGSTAFWTSIGEFLKLLPISIFSDQTALTDTNDRAKNVQSPLYVLEALYDGVAHKDEPRTNSCAAWEAYLLTCERLSLFLQGSQQNALLESHIYPLLFQYINSSPENSHWSIFGSQAEVVCTKACSMIIKEDENLFAQKWQDLSSKLVEDLKISLPEQSKDYTKSQNKLVNKASRWYGLQRLLLMESTSKVIPETLRVGIDSEVEAEVSVLVNRNGKPYGAAAALEKALELFPKAVLPNNALKTRLHKFGNEDLPGLLLSASCQHLVHILDLLQRICDVRQGFDKSTRILSEAPQSVQKVRALHALFSSPSIASNKSVARLAAGTLDLALLSNESQSWDILAAAFGNAEAPKDLIDSLLTTLVHYLSIEERRDSSFQGIELLNRQNPESFQEYLKTPKGSDLVKKLLFLADSPDDSNAQRALDLSNTLQFSTACGLNQVHTLDSSLAIIKRSFERITDESLSIPSLTSQAQKILDPLLESEKPNVAAELLPTPRQWAEALVPFLSRPPNPSLALTVKLGGADSLIIKQSLPEAKISYDRYGQSLALRMGQFVVGLAKVEDVFSLATHDLRRYVVVNLALLLQLAGDNVSVQGSMPLWNPSEVHSYTDIVDFITQAQSLLADWLYKTPSSDLTANVQSQLLQASQGLTPPAYYHGRAFSSITAELTDRFGQRDEDDNLQAIDVRKSRDMFATAAILSSVHDGRKTTRICNELLTGLTGYDFENDTASALRSLVLLNCILQHNEGIMEGIPQQRIIFFVKHVAGQSQKASLPARIEILKTLRVALLPIKEIYGSFWGEVFDIIEKAFNEPVDDENLPFLATSLRLLSLLRGQDMLDSNDDLLDLWIANKGFLAKKLVSLAGKLKDFSDQSHQPRRIANELLGRLLTSLSGELSNEATDLFALLASESDALLIASFKILHETIPSMQENLSLEKALEKSFKATLPEELLSLVIAPPSGDVATEASLDQRMPLSLHSYLLSWKLILDYWKKASYALQNDYAQSLQEGNYIADLLNLTFDILIISRHKPIDASKYSIETYEPGFEAPEKDMNWLLTHLYYLVLLHLPSRAKAWWRDTAARQTSLAVQAWTEKNISPLIISTELSAIREWAATQEANTEDPLTLKVSYNAHEITVSVPIDEQMTSISIRLPSSYPLARAEVASVHRVGIPENKWQAYIRIAQGQLTVSEGGSNSLFDCMLNWRRNVTAGLKGQTECAICYSVIGADKTLPKKECPTCKNRFHAGCLFRWFRSSNSSSCPLCRNTFGYQ